MSREFVIPKKILTGAGATKAALPYIAKLGKKPLIVTGKTVVTLPNFADLVYELRALGLDPVVFDGITGEPTDAMIAEGTAVYRATGCDFLIGMGGGSPLDSIKAIGVMLQSDAPLRAYMGQEIGGEFPPMVAIPTTAGTGSEATKFTVITDAATDVKMLLKGEGLVPDLAVIDPDNTKSAPKSVTASTGLDALTHAVEAYTSKQAQPLTDAPAISAVKRIFAHLPTAYRDGNDDTARGELAIAALEAGICINNSSVTLVHGMSRPIGALFHVPHGLSNAMLLEKCMRFAVDGAVARFADLGRAIGRADVSDSDRDAAAAFIEALRQICAVCEVPTLTQYGVEKQKFLDAIEKMASDAIASGSPANTRKTVRREDIVAIYRTLV